MRSVLLARLRHQRRSAVAVGVAVMLSVAFVAVVLAATSTMQRFVADAAAPRARVADLHVAVRTDPSGADVPGTLTPELLQRVRSTAGVDVVDPARTDFLSVTWPDGRAPGEVSTVAADPRLAWYDVVRAPLRAPPARSWSTSRPPTSWASCSVTGSRCGRGAPSRRPARSPASAASSAAPARRCPAGPCS